MMGVATRACARMSRFQLLRTVCDCSFLQLVCMQQGVRVSDVCPLLLSLSPHGRYYRGYLSIDGRDFAFALTLPSSGELKDARIECDWLLAQMLRGKEALLQKLLQESEDEALFLMKLKQILTHTSSSPGAGLAPPPPPRHPAHYTQLLADLDTIGWERVTRVSQDFSQLTITTLDGKQREHVFTVHMAQKEEEAPTITCDLPIPFKPSWTAKTTLPQMLERFEEQLKVHQVFWDVMDQLDRETWVLEPQQPKPDSICRRIVVCSNVSLYVSVDPGRPLSLPEFKFLGPEHVVGPIRHRMLAKVSHWDSSGQLTVRENLENLMDLKLPGPEESQQEGFCGECGVCYAYQLEGLVPEIVCDNAHCNQPFHFACLLEWLQTLPTTRQSFGVLFGECPYCNHQISVKLQR